MACFPLFPALLLAVASALAPLTVADPQTTLLILGCSQYDATPTAGFLAALNSTFAQLRANLSAGGGFANASEPRAAAPVFAFAQCRPYVTGRDCIACFDAAAARIATSCGSADGGRAVLDGCVIRYERAAFFYQTVLPGDTQFCNGSAVGGGFDGAVRALVSELTAVVPRVSGLAAAAAGSGVYAMAQCVETVGAAGCAQCLEWASGSIDLCSPNSNGRAVYSGCFMRYSDKRFFPANATVDLAPYLRSGNKKSISVQIALPIIAFLLLLTCIGLIVLMRVYKYRGKKRKKENQKKLILGYFTTSKELEGENKEFPSISIQDMLSATSFFDDSNLVGRGGFGKVYKGTFEGGKEVAVKRLSHNSGQGLVEFKNEVVLIAKLQHKNLVRLLGCCIHEDEKLLIYEYLPNKSLDAYIFDGVRNHVLDWLTRFKIIKGIARGLLYLHQDSRLTIIHRDLKASNILLDAEMTPKISDFGMARIFDANQNQANTNRVVGTYGYMSPEYAMRGAFSVKSDTYSFGVLLLEIVSGLKISSPQLITNFSSLITYAWRFWEDGKATELVDSTILASSQLDEVVRCIQVGLLCVQDHPNDRPLMSTVMFMIENQSALLPTPKQPTYFSLSNNEGGEGRESTEDSVNAMSITTLDGR